MIAIFQTNCHFSDLRMIQKGKWKMIEVFSNSREWLLTLQDKVERRIYKESLKEKLSKTLA